MKKILCYRTFILIVIIFSGCSEQKSVPDETEIINVLKDNLKAMQQEDIDLIKETTHSENPSYEAVISFCEKIFERYDLSYRLTEYKIDRIDGQEAELSFTQETKKINGPEFRNNKVTGVHTFRKESGNWKIYNTKIDKIEYL